MSETVVKPLSFIQTVYAVRPINRPYVEELRSRVRTLGVKPYPLSVTPDGVLYGGLHRYEAFKAEGVTECLMHVHQPASLDREAIELNQASADTLPMTFVDYAELVWRKREAGQRQQAVAEELGWTQQRVQQFAALQMLDHEVFNTWTVITTAMRGAPAQREDGSVVENTTPVVFSEWLLRSILDLLPFQRFECVRWLARGKDAKGHPFTKTDFKAIATQYRTYNRMCTAAESYLKGKIPADALGPYWDKAENALWERVYLDESTPQQPLGLRALKLLDALIADYEQEARTRILVKDMRDLTADDIPDGSIDAIVTDPPYHAESVELFTALGQLAVRVLKPGGVLLVLCGQYHLPAYIAALSPYLTYHWTCAVHLPGGQAVQIWPRHINTFWKPVLWFINGPPALLQWHADFWQTGINNNDKAHHEWGQSEELIMPMVERASLPGETVLDPFLGGGTTGVVCRHLGRVFIGVEHDATVAERALQRIGGTTAHV